MLLDNLRDERGRRVVLVSHCLLNENTRYAGGATRSGAVVEAVEELAAAGYGIHQLPCPERLAWGGVLKRRSLWLYDSKGGPLYPLRGVLLTAFIWWTKAVYKRLARQVAREVADYQRSGIAVDGIVGIGASPSCGVMTTLDLRTSLEVVASCPAAALTRDVMNEQAVLGCRRAGEGLFVRALDRELKRHRLTVPAIEHDLATELRGDRQALLAVKPPRTLGSAPTASSGHGEATCRPATAL
ncbi:2-thiouracil desulfurase family protein [Candidatus Mycolicibacterium alkanivorans]|uniref:2-thiouracil desulfurase family protein n=1 Tax=Candidatus Mycolicibacterium alkanivorans TaxID=2954114 RepID=A0ABS9YR08_9MYCO|nr:2-thiouracil desulfurase family protein [Candidatus Mycolicibacterium alkanivorans]MCI4673678.1 2-thiouracil desulfurase family protein [Candidatus Mycolicibacterium alkanivorans]